MRRTARLALATLVLVPASAGAGTTRPPIGLTASPAHVSLVGAGRTSVAVTNRGSSALVVDVGRAGFSLDLRGQPRIVSRGGARAATSWLTVRPARLALPPGATRSLTVSSRLPARVEPGDHDALVVLTTRPRRSAGVAVRMRVGIVVVVRAPGRIVRRLDVPRLAVRRMRGARTLELYVVNHGNITERLGPGRVRVALRRGRASEVLRAEPRELRPRSSGVVQFVYHGRLEGWVSATATITASPGEPPVRRVFRAKL